MENLGYGVKGSAVSDAVISARARTFTKRPDCEHAPGVASVASSPAGYLRAAGRLPASAANHRRRGASREIVPFRVSVWTRKQEADGCGVVREIGEE